MLEDKYVTVLIPGPVLEAMKTALEKEGFQNMSEVIRTALREYLKKKGYLRGDEE